MVDDPSLPNELLEAVGRLADVFARFHVRHALIGGLAAGYRSRPRFTRDVDLLLEIPQLQLPPVLAALREAGFTLDPERTIREWTRENFTSFHFGSVRIDWLKPVIPLFDRVLDGATEEAWPDRPIRIAAAEGLILTKLAAFRLQDQLDIESLLAANRNRLDLDAIRRHWRGVAELDDPRTVQFEAMVARLCGP